MLVYAVWPGVGGSECPAAGLLTPEALSGELVPEAGAGRVSPSW